MPHDDLTTLLDRLSRVFRAVELGVSSLERRSDHRSTRSDVADAVVDACAEGVRLGHELTLRAAEHDIWGDLETIHSVWVDIHARIRGVLRSDLRVQPLIEVARHEEDAFAALVDGVAELDQLQLHATARPRDHHASLAAQRAIRTLDGMADRFFMHALQDDADGRLDAALAMLTAVAARTTREREALTRRR